MKIYVGSDYRGFELKQTVLKFLATGEDEVFDLGTYDPAAQEDYNDAAIAVAKKVREDTLARGILICDSAHGMTIQANRFKGVRAAYCGDVESAKLAREHDDANILCLAAHFTQPEVAEGIITAFLTTRFEPVERRVKRINRLDEREDYA